MQRVVAQHGIPRLILPNTRRILSYQQNQGWGLYTGDKPAPIRPADRHHREPFGEGEFLVIGRRIRVWDEDVDRFVARMTARGHRFVLLEREDAFALLAFDRDVVVMTQAELEQAASARRVVHIWSWSSMGDSFVELGRGPGVEDDGVSLLFDEPVPDDILPQGGQFSPFDSVDDVWGPVAHHNERQPTDDEAGWPLHVPDALAQPLEARIAALTNDRYSFVGHCQERRMLPLCSTLVYTWALELDGTVQWIDHEAFGYPAEPETRRAQIWVALERGTHRYPELGELLPLRPPEVSRCAPCSGQGTDCASCDGLGWRIRTELP